MWGNHRSRLIGLALLRACRGFGDRKYWIFAHRHEATCRLADDRGGPGAAFLSGFADPTRPRAV